MGFTYRYRYVVMRIRIQWVKIFFKYIVYMEKLYFCLVISEFSQYRRFLYRQYIEIINLI